MLVNTSSYIVILMLVLLLTNSALGEESSTAHVETEEEVHSHPAHAVLYPSFIMTIGIVVYYVISRFLHWLPMSAVMFLLGAIMGYVSNTKTLMLPWTNENVIHDTLFAWQDIDSEVLLLVFLPGLIFHDALSQNPHLFAMGFGQLFIFAFPMVLAGTCLTACVAKFIFPFEWSFYLCLTFGSILAATDPVAVAALLEEVGAPARLTTHIAGESLLNDGAAIVFFSIFKSIFLYELGIEGIGDDVDFAQGVKEFVQKAIGGCAIGLVAGGAIIHVLSMLNRRFSKEENVMQVTAVFALVYLNYFVAEIVFVTSGVISTLTAGLIVKFFGRGAINDNHLMEDFFSVTVNILNAILFALGGLVWGETSHDINSKGLMNAAFWGYLFVLYALLLVIRAFLFTAVYPITVRIGLKTNWKETSFQIYGGLRGAVGIALAIALENSLAAVKYNDNTNVEEEYTDVLQAYWMVGGIAFLTLFINGATAGPFLKWLGLAESTEARTKIIDAYRIHLRATVVDSFVNLLTFERFKNIDFSFVQDNIPLLSDLSVQEIAEAVEKMKETTESKLYQPPYLQNVLAVLRDKEGSTNEEEDYEILNESPENHALMQRMERRSTDRRSTLRRRASTLRSSMYQRMEVQALSEKELRTLFLSMLRAQYEFLINEGILTSHHALTVALEQSLESAADEVDNGGKLNDLNHLRSFSELSMKYVNIKEKSSRWFRCDFENSDENFGLRSLILLEFAFTSAHENAQEFFQEQLGDFGTDLSKGGKIVLEESKKQVEEVRKDLNSIDHEKCFIDVSTHKICDVLLNRGITYIENLVKNGILKESEAEGITHELVYLLKKARRAKVNGTSVVKSEDPGVFGGLHNIREEGSETLASNAEEGSKETDFKVHEA